MKWIKFDRNDSNTWPTREANKWIRVLMLTEEDSILDMHTGYFNIIDNDKLTMYPGFNPDLDDSVGNTLAYVIIEMVQMEELS